MSDIAAIKHRIRTAFDAAESPRNWAISDSTEGDEPLLLRKEFAEKTDWRTLDAEFIDQSPDGYGSSLSFFSDEAFRYYLPAYLIVDLDDKLERVDPVFHLCHGLDDASAAEAVNPRRYGDRTWRDASEHRFSVFTAEQAAAIRDYLRYRMSKDEFDAPIIRDALRNYWDRRGQSV